MTTSVIGVDEGTDKYWDTDQRTKSGTAKESLIVLEGESANATYSVISNSAAVTSAAHLLILQGDGTNYCRLRRVFITQPANAGAAALAVVDLFRVSTAGTGGAAVTSPAHPYDTADAAFGGTVASLPTAKGTEGVQLQRHRIWLTTTLAAQPPSVEWIARASMKPIIWGPATTDGLAFKLITGITTATIEITVEFTVTAFL